MKLIIGLGNPGKRYQNTRHNIGWMILDLLAEKNKWHTSKNNNADYTHVEINGQDTELVKPLTFMNKSGSSVGKIVKKHNLNPAEDLIVVHDDLDIKFGEYKVQKDRSAAGHNGVKSIIEHLGTQDFTRIRIGVGKENKDRQGDAATFVLKRFSLFERIKLKEIKEKIAEEINQLI
ncbi:aminoacyl-tRNA hydrolase [Candidatus Falkowbacteria bacterium]|jgi:peptidyl-tRNA hydrolase, PTH1 family|nr:aminoacyl-tRNA hydrolase [Candidatus Falkowbacteria bacterium]